MVFRPQQSRNTPSTLTPVRKKLPWDFSVTGLVYCSMMMFMGMAAINSGANLLYAVFGLMIGVLLVAGWISRRVLRRLAVHRIMPETAVVGESTTLTYEFTNTKKIWPSLSISLGELDGTEAFTKQPFCYMLHAAPGMTATVPIEVIPKRRGKYQLERYQLSTSFPFGFIKRAVTAKQKDSIMIYPSLAQVDPKLLQLCRSADQSGATMRPRQGGNDEFYGVKEFRSGHNPRHIYWRRSARTGVLVAKEMTQVAPPRLVLLVDTFLPDRTIESHAAVECSIAMAASLASSALEDGLLVGLCVWSKRWITIPPHRGKRQRRDLLAVLAQLPLNTTHDIAQLLPASQGQLDAMVTPVLFTSGDVNPALFDRSRLGLVALSSKSPTGTRYFKFSPRVHFEQSVPTDQIPTPAKAGANHV